MPTAHFTHIARHLRRELALARHSIKLAVAWLTEPGLLAELGAAAKRGVAVEVVVSGHAFNDVGQLAGLAAAGAQVMQHPATESRDDGFLHHKFCVLDYATVITGSFNWSRNAGSSAENVLITRDDEALAANYLQEFQRLFLAAQPLPESAGAGWQPSVLRRLLGGSAPAAPAVPVRFWATRLLGAPGQETMVCWQAPAGWQVALEGLPAADELPARGHRATTFGEAPAVLTLTAQAPDGEPAVVRTLRLQPALAPEIALLALDRPTIVGRVMPAQLRWQVLHAETVRLEPGGLELPAEGEHTVAPAMSTTYTLVATGLGGTRQRSVSLGVFPLPVLGRLAVPVPAGLRIETQVAYASTPVPSGLDVRGSRFPFTMPRLQRLRAELVPPTPTLAQLAEARGLASPADLRLPPRLAGAPLAGWGRWKHDVLLSLEQRFAANHRLVHVLSTIRRHYT